MAETVQPYTVTATAGEFVAGILHDGAGSTIRLTDAQARYELLLGSIVPDGTPIVVEPPAGPIGALDRMALTRGGKAWDAAVGELLAFLLARILPEVSETLGDVEGRILGTAAATDNTLGKLATRIAILAEAVQGGLDLKAPRLSPEFSGSPTAPSAPAGANDARLANTNFVAQAIAALGLGSASRQAVADFAPALHGHGMSAVEGLLSSLADKAPLASPQLTGSPTAPSAPLGANDGRIANTNFVAAAAALKADLASPTFTGTPAVPTAAAGTNTTQAASTAFVASAVLALRDALVNGSGAALDTFREFADALGNDPNFAATIATALGVRLRFDAAQALTTAQRAQLFDNLAFNLVARTFVQAATLVDMRAAIGLGAGSDVAFRDIVASRGDGSGVVFLNAIKSRYLFYSGAAYDMPGADLYVNGSRAWTEGTAAGSIAADASYAIQRFPSGEAIIKGTSVVTLDANGRAVINVGLTAAVGTWLALPCNGDFGVSNATAIPGLNTATGFTVAFPGAANATVRVNWIVWGRWK